MIPTKYITEYNTKKVAVNDRIHISEFADKHRSISLSSLPHDPLSEATGGPGHEDL